MLFLFFMYATIIWGRPKAVKVKSMLLHGINTVNLTLNEKKKQFKISEPEKREADGSSELNSSDESDTESGSSRNVKPRRSVTILQRRPSVLAGIGRHHYGSFYLRMGAVGTKIT